MIEDNFMGELPPADLADADAKGHKTPSKLITTLIGGLAIASGASVGSMVAAGEPEEPTLSTVNLTFDDEEDNLESQDADEVDDDAVVAAPSRVSKNFTSTKTTKKPAVASKPVTELAIQPILTDLTFGNVTNTTQAWTGTTTSGNTTNSTQTTSGGGGSISGEVDDSHNDSESTSSDHHHDH